MVIDVKSVSAWCTGKHFILLSWRLQGLLGSEEFYFGGSFFFCTKAKSDCYLEDLSWEGVKSAKRDPDMHIIYLRN
jgi:hypothetical protein